MFLVDPKSEGLELYYKLDGTEKQQSMKIHDATGKIVGETRGIRISPLDKPIEVK